MLYPEIISPIQNRGTVLMRYSYGQFKRVISEGTSILSYWYGRTKWWNKIEAGVKQYITSTHYVPEIKKVKKRNNFGIKQKMLDPKAQKVFFSIDLPSWIEKTVYWTL